MKANYGNLNDKGLNDLLDQSIDFCYNSTKSA